MAKELAFVLINPATLAKERTGALISRLMTRTCLDLVGARMFGPGPDLTKGFSELLGGLPGEESGLLAEYVQAHYGPSGGKVQRVLLLLLEGEDAVAKVAEAVGGLPGDGATLRDSFGEWVKDGSGATVYFEPAVIAARNAAEASAILNLWADHSATDGGILEQAVDLELGAEAQTSLVMIKPDNFRFPGLRPGMILDLFTGTGLKLIGAKIHHMSVAEGEEFYGPVRDVLREKLVEPCGARSVSALAKEFGFELPAEAAAGLGKVMGPLFGDEQFFELVKFMTGSRPDAVATGEKSKPGTATCLVLIYHGARAIEKIRKALGPTNPANATAGTVRKEFGTDIMINAAHASDAPESVVREMGIVHPEADAVSALIRQAYPR